MVRDGEIIAAAQEERFTRKKHDPSFPVNAVEYCLSEEAVKLRDVDYVVFYDKPFLKFERLLEAFVALAPRGFSSFKTAMPLWIREKLFQKRVLRDHLRRLEPGFDEQRLLFTEHHLSHAASAYYPSPFAQAAVLTMDGVGEWATTSVAVGVGAELKLTREIHFPHSLGLLYSAFTYYLGFKVNSGEYKVMGLAPYGEPRHAQQILDRLIDLKDDGSFQINQEYFDYCTGLTMTNAKFAELFGEPVRKPEEPLQQRHMDLAASIQAVLEEAVLRITRSVASETGMENLCLAGGVALNCVANGKVLRAGHFKKIWVQPASGDAGGAVGAALAAYHLFNRKPRTRRGCLDGMKGSYLGPAFSQAEVERRLHASGAKFTVLDEAAMTRTCAQGLADGKALGWFQGRMEFGPRALGGRSILADARSLGMQSLLNLKVKYRESFRPFAPSVLREEVAEWFELDQDSPYMLLTADVASHHRRHMTEAEQSLFGIAKLNVPRSDIPAVTHVDYSARIQTVHRETNPGYHALLTEFKELTGCPVLVNTSFNVRGEPIVCTPEEAFQCFMGTELELLAIERCILRKEDQSPDAKQNYAAQFEPD